MTLLHGAAVAEPILADIRGRIKELGSRYVSPQLDVILIGRNPASVLYTSIKKNRGDELGIAVKIHQLPPRVREKTVLELIKKLNHDKKVTGIIVQMPVPAHISKEKLVWAIAPEKDVDGFQFRKFLPPAAQAILEILRHYGINPAKKRMLIIGKGFLVGKPLSTLATRHGARVVMADYGDNLVRLAQDAHIIVSAVGRPKLVTGEMVKPGQIVIDVGGDVDFEAVKEKAAAITPNPGGVGPVTVALLLQNVVKAATMTKVKQL